MCNRCRDLLMMSMNLNDIAILNIKSANYCCIISRISKNEAINLMQKTAQKVKFSIKDFFSKCDQNRSFLRLLSHLLKESLMETSFFVQWYRFDFKKGSTIKHKYLFSHIKMGKDILTSGKTEIERNKFYHYKSYIF